MPENSLYSSTLDSADVQLNSEAVFRHLGALLYRTV